MIRGGGNLFAGKDLPAEARDRTREALDKVERADAEELLSRDIDLLVDEYLDLFERATLSWDDPVMTEPKRVGVPTMDTFGRNVTNHAHRSTIKVAIDGDSLLLTYRSHQGAPAFSSIEGSVTPGYLEFEWTGGVDAGPAALVAWLQQRRDHVERFLVNNNNDVPGLNAQMRTRIRGAIESRREDEFKRRNLTANLPFRVERAAGASTPVRLHRTSVRVHQRPATATFAPEPELDQSDYEAILRDCVSMATVFERMPLASGTREEHLRNVLLGMLNTNFTGQATGETFNGAGKTDILIRHEDRNLFIGECKFYDGPKSVTDAVDQVLSYAVWRDTKTALLLFVRDQAFGPAVDAAVAAVSDHPQRQRLLPSADTSRRSDFILTRVDDPDRAIHLALLPFKLST